MAKCLRFFTWLLWTTVMIAGACRAHAAYAAPRPIRDVYVVLMVLDGCPAALFNQLLRDGQLPNLTTHLVKPGVTFTDAIATYPSTTSTGYQAMVSGLFPGHAGIPYLEWFERATEQVHRFLSLRGFKRLNTSFRNWYDATAGTLFEDLQGHETAAVYTQFFRSASTRTPTNPLPAAWAVVVQGRLEQMNALAQRDLLTLFQRPVAEIPRFTLAGLLATDFLGHKLGTDHPRVQQVLRDFDTFFGELVTLLRHRELLDKTYLIVTSDHGMHDIIGTFELKTVLRRQGLRVTPPAKPHYADLYFGARGVSVATLTARGPNGWQEPITLEALQAYPRRAADPIDLLELLTTAPELDLVLVREPVIQQAGEREQRVRLYRRQQMGILRSVRRGAETLYGYDARSGDPLEFTHDPQLRALTDGRLLTASNWIARLAHTSTPGAVPMLAQLFDDGHAGDLVVAATPDFDFLHEKRATHGTHYAMDMHVPLVIRGPGIRPNRRRLAQLVDLYPTMLRWFSLPVPLNRIDGRPLFE
ncbi:MAG: alkaline phosphatase family protein [Deltaproteobacteria bacterium]|nr:alkaline phosphatase family protein [Deltaproteobacteria bacterium]